MDLLEKQRLVAGFERSGKLLRPYSEEIGIPYSTFYGWVKRYGSSSKNTVISEKESSTQQFGFTQVCPPSDLAVERSYSFEVTLPNGILIKGDYPLSVLHGLLSTYV